MSQTSAATALKEGPPGKEESTLDPKATTPATAPATAEAAPRPSFMMNILNGIALGVIVSLIPGAFLGEILKVLLPTAPWLKVLLDATTVSTSMMAVVIGFFVGLNFKFTPIESGSIAIATQFASGAVVITNGAMVLKGTGDVITMGMTAALGAAIVLAIGERTRTYAILVVPVTVVAVAGVAGRLMLPYNMSVTAAIGRGIEQLLSLQPIVMAVLIAVVFSVLILSPVTTVGIALAISISGIGAGAANLGVCAAGFGFAVLGWRVNGPGLCVAHVLGSPKISMARFLSNPKIAIPTICSAALCGLVGVTLGIDGTPFSAGFGFSGAVGPVAFMSAHSWSMTAVLKGLVAFLAAPLSLALLFNHLFKKVVPLVKDEDYRLDIGR
ncbi:PTS transporter subunit IIC [Austwickia chelonae]|uniref:PTS transporter subunit IIC n=1 Tax=Austwickia chelonae TaxID=100225 RepID=UPI00196748CA|nr:PTS sugar transporter subunit IIC [Austwickia chelonae]